jgi:hypothetical protein
MVQYGHRCLKYRRIVQPISARHTAANAEQSGAIRPLLLHAARGSIHRFKKTNALLATNPALRPVPYAIRDVSPPSIVTVSPVM